MPAIKYHSIVIVGSGHDNIASLKASLGNNALVIGDGKQDISPEAITDALKHSSPGTHIHFWLHGGVRGGKHYVQLTGRNPNTPTSALLSHIKGTKGIIHLWSCHAGVANKDFLALNGEARLIIHGGEDSTAGSMAIEGIIQHHEFSRTVLEKYGRLPNAYDAFELSFLISPETVILPHSTHGKVKHIKINTPQNYINEAELQQDLQSKLAKVRQRRMKILGHNPENFVDMSPYITREGCTYYLEQTLALEVIRGNILQVQQYLDHGVNPNCRLQDGNTPLLMAYHVDVKMIETLLANGADVHQVMKDGATPLFIACQEGHDAVVKTLLANGANIHQVMEDDGTTPLYIACQRGHDAVVKTLLANGADVNQPRKDSFTPLLIACMNGHDAVVKTLLTNGADVNQAINGATPLFIACQEGHVKVAEILLENGANINQAKDSGATPLYIACTNGHVAVVKTLMANGANVNQARKDGTTPLFIACQNGHDAVIKTLMANGADVNQAKDNGTTPLHVACEQGHVKVAGILLANGANINQAKDSGATPLFIACQEGHDAVVETLLANGADVNQARKDGITPLFIACQMGHVAVVKTLLANSAHPGLPATNGITPLMVAIYDKREEIIDLFLPAMTLESIQKVHPRLGNAIKFAKDAGHHAIAQKIEHWVQKKQLEKQPSLSGTPTYTIPVPPVDAKALGQDDPQNMLGCGTELENVQEVAVDDIPDVTSGASRNTGILGDMAVLLKGVARLVSHGEKPAEPQATALPAPVAIMAAPAATPVGDGAWVVTTNTPESPCAHPGGGTNIIGSTGQQPEGALLPQCQGPKAETPGPGIGQSFTGGFVVGAITSATGKTVEAATQTLGADQDEAENYGFAAQGAVLAGLGSAAAVPGSVSGLASWAAGYVAPSAVTAAVSYAADQIGVATGISQAVQGYVPKGWEGTAGNTAKNMAVIAASSTVLSWFDPTASASSLISVALGSVAAQAAISAATDLITGKTSFADRVLAEREKNQQEQPQLRAA